MRMGIDDDLRAAQHRQRAQASAEERTRAELEQKRSAYHAEEAIVAAEVAAIVTRAQQLLDAHGKWERIQVFAHSRFAPDRAYFDGRIIPFPTSFAPSESALLATGHIASIQTWLRLRDASDAPTIEQWSTSRVHNARFDARTESRQSFYNQAFEGRFPSGQSLGRMQAQLAGVRVSVQDAVALMLSDAEVRL
jgi:hypothetical protein